MIRRVKWLVCDAPLLHAYMGRPILSALGLDSRVLLSAARDRLGLAVDVEELLQANAEVDVKTAHKPSVHSILQDNAVG